MLTSPRRLKKMVDAAESPPAVKSPSAPEGGMSFFRRYQKPILFTAVLFALVTFSIPVALTGFFTPSNAREGSTMMLPGGRRIQVTGEDYAVSAGLLAAQSDLATVLPDLSSQDNSVSRRSA